MTTRVAGFQTVPEGAPQLASFLRGLWVLLGAFAAFSGAAFFIGGKPTTGLIAILLITATATVLVASRLLATGRMRPAVLLASGALLGLLLIVGLVLPIEAEAAVGVLLAVAAGLPYLQGRALGGLMVAAWVVGVLVAVSPRILPGLQAGAPTTGLGVGAGVVSMAIALGFFLYVLWQHSRRLRAAIVNAEREHAAAEVLLRERSQLAAIVDSAEDAIISATVDGTILTWNGGAERLYGWSAAEMVGTSLVRTYPPELQHQIVDRLALMVAGERILGLETERMHRDGRRLSVSVSLAPIQDAAGRTIGVSGITRDIGERQRLRYELRESHEHLAAVIEGSTDAIFLYDLQNRYVLVNEAAAAYIGAPAAQILGRTNLDVLPPEVAVQFDASINAAREAGGAVRSEQDVTLNGIRTIWQASLEPYRNGTDEIVGVFGIARNVTHARTGEEALARSEALLAAAEVIANLGSFEVDLATGRVQWSDHLYRMADIEPGSQVLDYEAFLAIIHPDDQGRVRATIEEAIGRRSDHAYEFRVPRRDGTERVLSCQARVVSDPDGRPLRIYGTAQDITDTRRLEHEFRQAQKMEAVGRLAGGIAHDFNNVLTAIIGYGQILAETLAGKPEAAWVDQIEGAARHAAGLTRQLLAFSRRQLLQPEVLDLSALVDELAPMLQLMIGKNVELITTVEPATGHVLADPSQLQQVLLNLAGNARDAMPDGGRVTISVGNDSLDAARGAELELPPGSYVSLTFEDDGKGMDDATKARVFEPFFTTKEVGKGTGLGLAMAHGVVTQSGGHIAFDSELGRGTRFRIILPSVGSAPLPGSVKTPEPVRAALSGRVLVVEDEPMIRELARLTLEANGLSVVEAADAESAIEAIERSPAFDLVISDVVMPGLGGGALAQDLRARGDGVPIIFMSGYPRDAVVSRGVSDAEYPYLAKPFRPSQLMALVSKTLRARTEAVA
jgi:PAS domain S-box-containing protein